MLLFFAIVPDTAYFIRKFLFDVDVLYALILPPPSLYHTLCRSDFKTYWYVYLSFV